MRRFQPSPGSEPESHFLGETACHQYAADTKPEQNGRHDGEWRAAGSWGPYSVIPIFCFILIFTRTNILWGFRYYWIIRLVLRNTGAVLHRDLILHVRRVYVQRVGAGTFVDEAFARSPAFIADRIKESVFLAVDKYVEARERGILRGRCRVVRDPETFSGRLEFGGRLIPAAGEGIYYLGSRARTSPILGSDEMRIEQHESHRDRRENKQDIGPSGDPWRRRGRIRHVWAQMRPRQQLCNV
ncbi:hypothetical protein BH20ACT11_BH20ACT11_06660 [soil metagenome]